MTNSVIAAQLYTVRDACKTAAELAATLKRIREIGYQAVQISGIGPIDPHDVKRILNDTGLHCCITHIGLDTMRNEFDAVIEKHRLWNCPYSAIGGFFPKEPFDLNLWQGFVDQYNQLVAKYAAAGLQIGYHNHSHELTRIGQTTPLHILVSGLLAPAFIEIDTYWITHGGGDPIEWINRCTGRLPFIHLKDMAIVSGQQRMAPVGEGNLNMAGIIASATRAGTRWFIVEQDDCYGRDPFDCLATSFRNLRELGLR